MLTEDLVIYHVRDHLVANGWEIVSLAIFNKCGTDEVAVYAGIRLELEVRKGSSKPLTRLYARELNSITCAAGSAAVPTGKWPAVPPVTSFLLWAEAVIQSDAVLAANTLSRLRPN